MKSPHNPSHFVSSFIAGILVVVTSCTVIAKPDETAGNRNSSIFSLDLVNNPSKPRGILGRQFLSYILPGFDQWYEDQKSPALFYSGSALLGLKISIDALLSFDLDEQKTVTVDERDDLLRRYLIGSQIFQAAGGFSAYASFRSAVRSRKPNGEFEFLKHEESVDEILLAPFKFSHLANPRVYIPLLLITGYAAYSWNEPGVGTGDSFGINDAFYASAFSFNAGTHEEAMFRGWLMPVAMHYMKSPFWSNTSVALLFASAHISKENPVPIPQFLLGWYFGYVTQKNEWRLEESVFLHTWWDIVAFTATYLWDSTHGPSAKAKSIQLPPLVFTF